MVVLTARDEKRGLEAVAKLHESSLSNVVFHQLDVMDADSITSLATFIVTRYGKLDILVRNQPFLEGHFLPIFLLLGKKKKYTLGIWEFEIIMIPHLEGSEKFIPQSGRQAKTF